MKRTLHLILLSTIILSLVACSGNPGLVSTTNLAAQVDNNLGSETADNQETNQIGAASNTDPIEASSSNTPVGEYDEDDLATQPAGLETTSILLEGDKITVGGSGAEVTGSVVTITAGGDYLVTGSLKDGQLIVNSPDEEIVHLILQGVDITSSSSAPIFILSADKTVITLAEGTDNTLTDGSAYQLTEDDEPNAPLFSKDDLTINGSGSLTVNGNYNNGIVSKDDLKIISGSIIVQAVNDGIKGKDTISVLDGEIQITAGGDGMQANNDQDLDKGTVVIDGGTLLITAALDGIQAATTLLISGGDISISSGGGSANGPAHWDGMNRGADFGSATVDTGESTKGLKAGVLVSISGGSLTIDSADDTIHSNDSVLISGGVFQLSSGDDGVHADTLLNISGGNLVLSQSYEGIESAEILISGGDLHLASNDDGINGSTGSGEGGMPGMGGFGGGGDSTLAISGGYIYIDAGGDGVDVNGSVQMSDGTLLVNGPTNSGNGALDYLGEFSISGGTLVAVGSAGMAQAPSQSSSQYSLLYIFEGYLSAGSAFHLESDSGESILTFVPSKEYQAVVISTPELADGGTYQISVGGTISASLRDGFATDGDYSGGTVVDTVTLTGMVTAGGAAGGGFMMGVPGGGRPRGGGK